MGKDRDSDGTMPRRKERMLDGHSASGKECWERKMEKSGNREIISKNHGQ